MRTRRSARRSLLARVVECLAVGGDLLGVGGIGREPGVRGGFDLQRLLTVTADTLDVGAVLRQRLPWIGADLAHAGQRVAALLGLGGGRVTHRLDVVLGRLVAEQAAVLGLGGLDVPDVLLFGVQQRLGGSQVGDIGRGEHGLAFALGLAQLVGAFGAAAQPARDLGPAQLVGRGAAPLVATCAGGRDESGDAGQPEQDGKDDGDRGLADGHAAQAKQHGRDQEQRADQVPAPRVEAGQR